MLSTVKSAVDAVRSLHEAGELEVVMLTFDAAGRFASVARLDGVALLGDLTKPAEVPAGIQLLIDVGAVSSNIDARLRAAPNTVWRIAGRSRSGRRPEIWRALLRAVRCPDGWSPRRGSFN